MKNLNEMSKAEMEQEISFAKEFVNNGGLHEQRAVGSHLQDGAACQGGLNYV